jgi:hypothetical protein
MRRILLDLVCAIIAAILIVAAAKSAGAAERHHRGHLNPVVEGLGHGLIHMLESVRRPARWCGWEMRQLVSSDPGPTFNLARSWASWGQSGPAGVGAVVVWPHHVGKIVGQQGGTWVVESGNDGHAVRTRPRSLAGVIAIRWGD